MTHTNFFQKVLLLFFSLFFSLIILELGLRLAQAGFLFIQYQQNQQSLNKSNEYRIMCIGESTTALGGENSYPSQLQKILDKENKNYRYTVINQGVPGVGSDYIVNHLEGWLKQYHPQAVVVMMGINDKNKLIPIDQAFRHDNFLSHLRVVALFRWVYQSLYQPLPIKDLNDNNKKPLLDQKLLFAIELAIQQKNYDVANQALTQILGIEDNDVQTYAWNKLNFVFKETNNVTGRLNLINEYLSDRVPNIVISEIGQLCQDKQYAPVVIKMLEFNLEKSKDQEMIYNLLSGCHKFMGDSVNRNKYDQLLEKYRSSRVNLHTRSNHKKLITKLQNRGIKVILMQYPTRDIESLQLFALDYIHDKNIIWVENKSNFQEALRTHPYKDMFTDIFAGDFGHCTPFGNELIAKQLANKILLEDN